VLVIGVFTSIALASGFSSGVPKWVASFFIFVALLYFTFLQSMVRDYVKLATIHCSFKERHARRQCTKEYCTADELKT